MNLDSLFEELPKVELHLHLDGSLSPEFIFRAAKARGISLECETPKDLHYWLLREKSKRLEQNSQNSVDKNCNWPVFDFCNRFLQTKEELKEGTLDLLSRLISWNVFYVELRFCPELHTKEGLSSTEAVEAVLKAFEEKSRIMGGVLICCLRSQTPEHGLRMAELAGFLRKTTNRVLGFDVCGDEGSFPLDSSSSSMFPAVKRAQELFVPVTIHAGEWPNTLSNVLFALKELQVSRIGHGIALRSLSSEDLSHLKEYNFMIEVCLTSNVGNSFKVSEYKYHPVKLFIEHEIPFSLSCDNLLLSGDERFQPSPPGELKNLLEKVLESDKDGIAILRKCLLDGIRGAFFKNKEELLVLFEEKMEAVFKKYNL